MCWSVNKTSDDGCIFIVRPQVLPASHMDTHGTGVLAHAGQPEEGQDVPCVCVCVAQRECVDATWITQVLVCVTLLSVGLECR